MEHVETHPVDYVALGSHANYFSQTSSPTQFLRCVYKNVDNVDRSKARRLVGLVQNGLTDRTGHAHELAPTGQQPLKLVDLDDALPLWARFPGRWSEGELLWVGRTPTRSTRVRSALGPLPQGGLRRQCRLSGTPIQANGNERNWRSTTFW